LTIDVVVFGREHGLRRRVENEEVFLSISHDDGLTHVREDGLENFISPREFGCAPCHAFFQLLAVPAQRLFHLSLLGDIGVGAQPAHHEPGFVANRHGPRKEPAILAAPAAQWEGIVPYFSGNEGVLDAVHHAPDLIWMVHLLPAPSLHLLECGPSVIVPALVVPKYVTLG